MKIAGTSQPKNLHTIEHREIKAIKRRNHIENNSNVG